jgi:hypothetical protein
MDKALIINTLTELRNVVRKEAEEGQNDHFWNLVQSADHLLEKLGQETTEGMVTQTEKAAFESMIAPIVEHGRVRGLLQALVARHSWLDNEELVPDPMVLGHDFLTMYRAFLKESLK